MGSLDLRTKFPNQNYDQDVIASYGKAFAEGFHIVFDNEYIVSVVAGYYAGDSTYGYKVDKTPPNVSKRSYVDFRQFNNFEIVIFDNKHNTVTKKWSRGCDGYVKGYATVKDLLRALNWAERQKPIE